MADVTQTENTVSSTTTTYSLLGDDGITVTCVVVDSSMQVTTDDVNGNANVQFRITSLATLLSIFNAVQTNVVAPASP